MRSFFLFLIKLIQFTHSLDLQQRRNCIYVLVFVLRIRSLAGAVAIPKTCDPEDVRTRRTQDFGSLASSILRMRKILFGRNLHRATLRVFQDFLEKSDLRPGLRALKHDFIKNCPPTHI